MRGSNLGSSRLYVPAGPIVTHLSGKPRRTFCLHLSGAREVCVNIHVEEINLGFYFNLGSERHGVRTH